MGKLIRIQDFQTHHAFMHHTSIMLLWSALLFLEEAMNERFAWDQITY